MLNLFITYPYSGEPQKIRTNIPLKTGGVTKAVLKTNPSNPYQLNLSVNPQLGQIYDLLQRTDVGVIVQHDGLSINFVRRNDSTNKSENLNGELNLFYLSDEILLDNLAVNPRKLRYNSVFKGAVSSLLGNIPQDNYYFRLVGSDRQIAFPTGALDNFQILKKITEVIGDYQYRNAGVQDLGAGEKTVIEIGDFSVLPIKHTITNHTKLPDPFTKNKIQFNRIEINYSGEVLTGVLPYSDNGGGFDPSSSTLLKNPSAPYIQPNFPLIPTNVTTTDGATIYYIENTNTLASAPYPRIEAFGIQAQANIIDFNTTGINPVEFSLELSEEELYNRAVNFLRGKSENERYRLDIDYRGLILPFEKIEVKVRQLIDFNQYRSEISVDDIFYSTAYTFDLSVLR